MLDESQTGRQAAARSAVGDLYDVLEENGNDWQRVRPRTIQAEQLRKLEGHAREIFETLGMDLSSPATEHTPRRLGPSLVLTTREGEARLRGRVPHSCKIRALPQGQPSVVGQLVAEQLLDELFLTVAPRLVGPAREGSRKSLVEGADVLDRAGAEARLLSLRRQGSYLFLRYRLGEVNGHE